VQKNQTRKGLAFLFPFVCIDGVLFIQMFQMPSGISCKFHLNLFLYQLLIVWLIQVEQKQEHTLRPLPNSLLRRVRELAKIHPYPRVRISKKSQVAPAMLPCASKVALSSLGGRSVLRKNCT
jgi:hypothetical protein